MSPRRGSTDNDGCGILICAIIAIWVVLYAVGAIANWVSDHWYTILAVVIGVASISAIVGGVALITRHLTNRKQAAEDFENAQDDIDRLVRLRKEVLNNFVSVYLAGDLIIDSNIWMNDRYGAFFVLLEDALIRKCRVLDLFGAQFDEICNIKARTSYDDQKNRAARLAIHRIESLQKIGRLAIKPISVNAKRGAYADPLLVKLMLNAAKQDKPVTMLSNDKELRIRVRETLRENGGSARQKVESLDELINSCTDYVQAKEVCVKKGSAQVQ